jgi:ribokinase
VSPGVVSRVLVVGSANVDIAITVLRLPRPGETVSDGTLLVNHGGKGANQAVAARRLGADVRFLACLGADAAGRDVRAALEREGVDVSGVVVSPAAATGTAVVVVDAAGRNQIAVAPGANRALTVEHLTVRQDDFTWADVVLCQLETPIDTVRWVLDRARRHRVITVLNPAPVPDRALDVWDLLDYVTPNAGEAERLSGIAGTDPDGVRRAAAALRGRGARTVVVTLGDEGALACHADGWLQVPAFPVDAVDTTAAGDAFNAGLAVAVGEGRGLRDALRFASAAAGLTCTHRGAQPSLPVRNEVERLLSG